MKTIFVASVLSIMALSRAIPSRPLCIALIAFLLSVSTKAENPKLVESSWTDLTMEPSRQELFEKIIDASGPREKALPQSFFFPDDAQFDTKRHIARDKVVFGVDVSHHNGDKLNLVMLGAQKVDFVYAKAT